jgi:phosphoribosyl-dephospho-CoA transferase
MSGTSTARVHDLVLFDARPYRDELPHWVEVVDGCAWAVVRRQRPTVEGRIAAGVRGARRGDRHAFEVDARDMVRSVTPESLALRKLNQARNPEMARTLERLQVSAHRWFGSRAWGPAGSVGYELASGLSAVRATSDLDLIVRVDEYLDRTEGRAMLDALATLPSRVDCLMETGRGAVALAEWSAASSSDVLLRTADGPLLTADPWSRSTTRIGASA